MITLKRMLPLLAITVVIGTGLAFWLWLDPEAPKAPALATPSASPTEATTFIPSPLFKELKKGEYKEEPFRQVVKEGQVVSTQVWESPDGYRAELAAVGSTPMKLRSVTFPGHDGQSWTCSPDKAQIQTIDYVINYGNDLRKEVADGTTKVYSDGGPRYVNGGTIDCNIL